MEAGMPAKTVAAFLCGVIVASTGTAAALTRGHVFQLQQGDEAQYGKVQCQAINVAQYSGFSCWRVRPYSVIYEPTEIRVLRTRLVNGKYVSQSIFHLDPRTGSTAR